MFGTVACMHDTTIVREVVNLTDTNRNLIFNMSLAEATERVARGDVAAISKIDGHFAIVATSGHIVRMARSLQLPMRYFIVKRQDGPALLIAERIDQIQSWLNEQGLGDQFHPSYTRMVPAHHLTEVALLGCPDPNPEYHRFFNPPRDTQCADLDSIGSAYIGAVADGIDKWLDRLPGEAPIGVLFSGGIDSGAVFLLTYWTMLERGMNPARLKAFTLDIDRLGEDLRQARDFLHATDLEIFHEPIEVPLDWLDLPTAVETIEDYKPLDIQAGAMTMAICRGIRERYPEWTWLIDGDGGDENLKDYPIEENPELTIRSVLNNLMLYHEGWGVDSIKHSLTYSGGLSRGCTRGYAATSRFGFRGFSPFMLPRVIAVSEGIPFIELTNWDHERLYALKGEIVRRGVESRTGITMPVFEKRRFQHGAVGHDQLSASLPDEPDMYRKAFHAVFNT